MKLLQNEESILTSNDNSVVLTNQRIYMNSTSLGQAYTISIFLEDVSSMELKYTSVILFLVIAVLCLIAGVLGSMSRGQSDLFIAGLVFGLAFLALWWGSRKHVISISSNGGSVLNFSVSSMSDSAMEDFLYNLSAAKRAKVNQLANI